MGIFIYELEHTSVTAPSRLFKALFRDSDNLIPLIAPRAIKCSEILEGNGGVGTIKKITFGEGSQFGFVKHRIDGIDEASYYYRYTLIEGDMLSDKIEKIEKIEYETKLVAGADGRGCTVKNVSKYYTVGDAEMDEELVTATKEETLGLIELIEAHLEKHPNLYN